MELRHKDRLGELTRKTPAPKTSPHHLQQLLLIVTQKIIPFVRMTGKTGSLQVNSCNYSRLNVQCIIISSLTWFYLTIIVGTVLHIIVTACVQEYCVRTKPWSDGSNLSSCRHCVWGPKNNYWEHCECVYMSVKDESFMFPLRHIDLSNTAVTTQQHDLHSYMAIYSVTNWMMIRVLPGRRMPRSNEIIWTANGNCSCHSIQEHCTAANLNQHRHMASV